MNCHDNADKTFSLFSRWSTNLLVGCSARAVFTIVLLSIALFFISCTTMSHLDSKYESFETVDAYFAKHDIPKISSSLPQYYFTGQEWKDRLLELIEMAEDYILFIVFAGTYHEINQPVWDALAQKAYEGVQVYCIIDSVSYFVAECEQYGAQPPASVIIRETGIHAVDYNPISLSNIFYMPQLLDRDHRKFWIIDGKRIVMGGTNINVSSFGRPPDLGNIDTMAEVISPEGAEHLIRSFVETWNAYSSNKLCTQKFAIPELDEDRIDRETSFWLIDHYWPKRSQVTPMFDVFFLAAQEELWLVQAFTFVTPGILNRIRFAVNRGVEVNILLSERETGPHYRAAAFYGIKDLIDAGANVYMYELPKDAFLHYKLFMADRKLTALGSVNFNFRSQTYSREISYVFDDSRVGADIMENLEELLEDSRRVDRDEAKEYRTLHNLFFLLLMKFWG